VSNIYLERLRAISGTPAVQELQKLQEGDVIHGKPPVQALQKVQKGSSCSFCSARTTGIAKNEALPARRDRTASALRTHAAAIRPFRRATEEPERLAALYRSKTEAHTAAARKLLPPEGFAAWLADLELEGDRHE